MRRIQRSLVSHILILWLLVAIVTDKTVFGYVSSKRDVQYYNCLKNVKTKNISSTSVTLAWDFKCDDGEKYDNVRYKITTTHLGWLACKNKLRKVFSHDEVDNKNEFTINHLHSYSNYDFEIKAIPTNSNGRKRNRGNRLRPDEKSIFISTIEGIPNIAPRESTFVKPSVNADRITFFWRPPVDRSCKTFNGELDGYKYVLKGMDQWSKKDEYSGDTRPDVTNFVFEGLQPMSRYSLKVYVKNSLGEINTVFPLELTASTRQSDIVDRPPQHLKAVLLSDGSLHLSWQPPYPPSSTIEKYIVQWKVDRKDSNRHKWDEEFDVIPESDSCQKLNIPTVNPELMCHKIDNFTHLVDKKDFNNIDDSAVYFGDEPKSQINFGNLEISNLIVFRISAVAPNQHAVDIIWSKKVTVTSEGEQVPEEEEGTGWIAISVIVTLVIVFIFILIVICVRHKCNQTSVLRNGNNKKGSYKHVPPYESQYNGMAPPSLQTQPSILSESSDVNQSITTSWGMHHQPSVEFRRSLPPPQRPQRNSKSSFSPPQNSTLPRNVETGKDKTKDYSHILLPRSPSQTQPMPSILGTPLPPVPTEEPIYDELNLDTIHKEREDRPGNAPKRHSMGHTGLQTESHKYSNTNKNSSQKKSEGFESEDDFLEPVDTRPAKQKEGGEDSDDNDYLAPTTREKRPNTIDNLFRKSCSDIDNANEDEYLKPTFNQFDRINSRDLSPPHEKPPPIPMQSYGMNNGNERIIPIQIEK